MTLKSTSPLRNMFDISGSLINHVLCAKPTAYDLSAQQAQHCDHVMDYSVPVKQPNCDVCFEFFDRFIRISSIARAALAPDTSTQDNQIWTDARKIRITSSRANAVPKTERGNPDVFIKSHLQPRFKGNRATQHGTLNEDRAREQFQLTSGSIVVELCGTVFDTVICGCLVLMGLLDQMPLWRSNAPPRNLTV